MPTRSHVILFVFVLGGTCLLGGAGRRCSQLCLLGSLLHLQPLLLCKLRLLLSGLQHEHIVNGLLTSALTEDNRFTFSR